MRFCRFEDFELPANSADSVVWQVCQDNGVILITGNRNSEGPESLNSTIENRNGPDCLPVLTLASAKRIARDRQYAQLVVESLFDTFIRIDVLRGTGRLYLP